MTITKLNKQAFHDTQYNNYPIGAVYYVQELDDTTKIYHGLIITTQYQLFAEFTRLDDLETWVAREFPSMP